ncbi:MAG TPA: hypothetical protein VFZ78_01780 [Flavisolibacter sp.]
MKKMLIAAAAIGSAIAGLVLYARKSSNHASKTRKITPESVAGPENLRPPQHAMG